MKHFEGTLGGILSENENSINDFQLVFEGLDDSSPQSLQRIKGILVGEMGLSIEDAQNALANHPLTIKRDNNEKLLSVYFENLKNAGAKVAAVNKAPRNNEGEKTANNLCASVSNRQIRPL